MRKNNHPLTREDYNFIVTQRSLCGFDIIMGMVIIFILANIAMSFTNNIFIHGILPSILGIVYTSISISNRLKHIRDYWENN